MSLNGLDAADIHDAYEAALLEAGGWSVFAIKTLQIAIGTLTREHQVAAQLHLQRLGSPSWPRQKWRTRGSRSYRSVQRGVAAVWYDRIPSTEGCDKIHS